MLDTNFDSTVSYLQQLDPGLLPLEVFNAIARLTRMTIINITPVRRTDNGVEVGLILREKNDLWWPNLWHLPGTVLRPTDTMETAFARLLQDELHIDPTLSPQFITFLEHRSKRGAELVLIHTIENVEIQTSPSLQWFPISQLPENFVDTEQHILDKISL